MKKLIITLIAISMLTMSICAQAAQGSAETSFDAESCVSYEIESEVVTEDVLETSLEPQIAYAEQRDANGNYDDKYHADYEAFCNDYEKAVELYLGIVVNPLDPDRKHGIKPERTEPWWDEWIAEMLSEGLIEQAWYDEMVEKGYIIEVD